MGRPTISGPEVPSRGTGPIHGSWHTAGGPTTSSASKSVPDTQPPGTDRQLADAVDSNSGHAARYEGTHEKLKCRDKAPETAEPPDREDKPGLAVDSGYSPSLWAEELDTPKQQLSYDEMPDHPCGRRGETEVCYITIEH